MEPIPRIESWPVAVGPVPAGAPVRLTERERRRREQREETRRRRRDGDEAPEDDEHPHVDVTA